VRDSGGAKLAPCTVMLARLCRSRSCSIPSRKRGTSAATRTFGEPFARTWLARHEVFRELVGTDLASDPATSVHREPFAHGGMSSGMISLDTWRQPLMAL